MCVEGFGISWFFVSLIASEVSLQLHIQFTFIQNLYLNDDDVLKVLLFTLEKRFFNTS